MRCRSSRGLCRRLLRVCQASGKFGQFLDKTTESEPRSPTGRWLRNRAPSSCKLSLNWYLQGSRTTHKKVTPGCATLPEVYGASLQGIVDSLEGKSGQEMHMDLRLVNGRVSMVCGVFLDLSQGKVFGPVSNMSGAMALGASDFPAFNLPESLAFAGCPKAPRTFRHVGAT